MLGAKGEISDLDVPAQMMDVFDCVENIPRVDSRHVALRSFS